MTNAVDADVAMRFCIEVAKVYGQGALKFYDEAEWAALQQALWLAGAFADGGTRPIERFGAAAVR